MLDPAFKHLASKSLPDFSLIDLDQDSGLVTVSGWLVGV